MYRIVKFHEQIDHLKSSRFDPVETHAFKTHDKDLALQFCRSLNERERDLSMTWRIEEIKP